jgi:hypothetical protein
VTEYSLAYHDFIDSELKTERDRRTNLESRGGAIVSQSGTLSTLLIATAAFVRGSDQAELPTFAVGMVIVSTVLFLGSGVLAILISFPFLYKGQPVADGETMKKMLTIRRGDPDPDARTVVATVRVGTLTAMRDGNERKVKLLSAAHISQMVGLVFLLLAVLAAIVWQPAG